MTTITPRTPVLRRGLATVATVLVGLLPLAGLSGTAQATTATHVAQIGAVRPAANISDCALSSLPAQAADTVKLIHSGGPFPYPKNDGVIFDNREGVLPSQSSGYYHEYTVPTPGSSNRGTRRIVTGGQPLTNPQRYYYTGDHYKTFCNVTGAGSS